MLKKIILISAAGLISFAGAFAFAWFSKPKPMIQTPESEQAATQSSAPLDLSKPPASISGNIVKLDADTKRSMTEEQLRSLTFEIREKITEYENKLQSLEIREHRLEKAHGLIKNDLDELSKLRVELSSVVQGIKNERNKLEQTKVEIEQTEAKNLISIAAAYDKMDPASAGKILANMTQMANVDGPGSFDDAVKILHYMAERTKAKLLAELSVSKPDLAALFCRKLKQIVEKQ